MSDQPEGVGHSAQEAAAYVAELGADLAQIARKHRLDMLAYLLEMARLEALHAAGSLSNPPGRELS